MAASNEFYTSIIQKLRNLAEGTVLSAVSQASGTLDRSQDMKYCSSCDHDMQNLLHHLEA